MDSVHSQQRLWKCHICSKEFKRKEVLLSHREAVHGNKSRMKSRWDVLGGQDEGSISTDPWQEATLSQAKIERKDGATCSICTKQFKRKEYLVVSPFRVLVFPTIWLNWVYLFKEHMKIHSGEVPYKCPRPECGKEIRMRSNYLKHLQVHKRREEKGTESGPVLIILDN